MAADASQQTSNRLDTIVLLGAFNPLILTPPWLRSNEIISEFDLEQATRDSKWFATREVSQLQFRTWFLLADVQRVQITLTPEAETPMLLADIVVNIFGLLGHTPVHAVGLNHVCHGELPEGRTEEILELLAPSEAIAGVLPGIRLHGVDWQADRPDEYAGQLGLVVQSSTIVRGLYCSLNDHFDLGEAGSGRTAADLVGAAWQDSLQRANDVFATLLALQ